MEIVVCDWCKKMIEGPSGRRVPVVQEDEEYWDLCLDICLPRYNEYRRAAQEIIERHEREQRHELLQLKEETIVGAKT